MVKKKLLISEKWLGQKKNNKLASIGFERQWKTRDGDGAPGWRAVPNRAESAGARGAAEVRRRGGPAAGRIREEVSEGGDRTVRVCVWNG